MWLNLEMEPVRKYPRLKEVIRVGPQFNRVSVFRRRDTREFTCFPCACIEEKAFEGRTRRWLTDSQEERAH